MDKFQAVMERTIVPIGMKISQQKYLAAIRDGMTVMIPITIIGGFACLLAVPPAPVGLTGGNIFADFLLAWQAWAAANASVLMIPYHMTIGIISVFVVCGVAYQLAQTYKMDGVNNMLCALLVFLCVSDAVDLETVSISISKLGASYMFGAMMIGLLVVEINHQCIKHNISIKLPASVPPNVAAPFNVLIPMTFSVVGFTLLNVLCTAVTGAGITSLVYTIFQPLLSATGSLPSVLLINVIMTTFWFFGIHGANMVSVVTSPITTAALAANLEAYQANQPLPYIFSGAVNSVFGNWITYFAILLVVLFFCKSSQLKSVAKVASVCLPMLASWVASTSRYPSRSPARCRRSSPLWTPRPSFCTSCCSRSMSWCACRSSRRMTRRSSRPRLLRRSSLPKPVVRFVSGVLTEPVSHVWGAGCPCPTLPERKPSCVTSFCSVLPACLRACS